MDENIFSGIPSLDDVEGLEQLMSTPNASDFGLNDDMPAMLQQQQQPIEPATPTAQPAVPAGTTQASDPQTQQPNAPTFTSEQVAQIIARMQHMQNQQNPARPAQPSVPQGQPRSAYTPQQAAAIKQLVDRGVPLERIVAAMQGSRQQNQVNGALVQRLQNIEQYLQTQQYKSEESAFINKMSSFGEKFGLSEADLVTFGNQALAMGINLTQVSDVEAVFRAVYPEQYAIRSQRIAGAAAPQIYGGATATETPRASASKIEDAYVEAFLKNAMPNAYGRHSK